jgi:plastocyanin
MVFKCVLILSVIVWNLFAMSTVGFTPAQYGPSEEEPKHYVVEAGDFFFEPAGLLIQPGDTVEWVFVEITVDGHTTTAYHPDHRKELRMPEAAKPWDSGFILEKDKTFSVRFTVTGVYDYFCLFHEFLGMIGRIIVKEPAGPVVANPTVPGLPPAAMQAMPSIAEIMGPVGKIFNLSGQVNSVVQSYRVQNPERALEQLDTLLEELRAGRHREGSTFEVLRSVNLATEVEQGLRELRRAIVERVAIERVEKHAKTIKDHLAEARKRLKAG